MPEQKIIDRIKALVALAESEANQTINPNAESVAANILSKAHELARKHRIDLQTVKSSEEISLEEQIINVLGKTIVPNPFLRVNAKTNLRLPWFEELARVIAEGFYCKLGINKQTGEVSFYGYDSDREIAVFMLLKIAEIADRVCNVQMDKVFKKVGTTEFILRQRKTVDHPKEWMGDDIFINSFHLGYAKAIESIFKSKLNEEEPKNDEVEEFYRRTAGREFVYNNHPDNYVDSFTNQEAMSLGSLFGAKAVSEKNGNGKTSKSNSLTVKKSASKKKLLEANYAGDIYFLIDNSYSMHKHNKLGQAKEGIINYANQVIQTNHKIGLVRFGTFAQHITVPISDPEKFAKLVNKMELKGEIVHQTKLASAIGQAQARFLYRNIRRVICIATDGFVQDSVETLKAAELAKASGIEIMCIGTEDADHNFLSQLASKPKLALKARTEELESGIKKMVALLGE